MSGKLFIICAPSGTGKSTLIKRLLVDLPEIRESVSFTTRPSRPGEVEGEDYFFVDVPNFKSKIENDELIEWAEVHQNYYGTSRTFIERQLEKGRKILLDLDVQGADNIKKYFGDRAIVVFIAPPSIDELERRLRGRGTEQTGIINLRLENAKAELKRKDDYDHCVVNDDLDLAYGRLKNLFDRLLE